MTTGFKPLVILKEGIMIQMAVVYYDGIITNMMMMMMMMMILLMA